MAENVVHRGCLGQMQVRTKRKDGWTADTEQRFLEELAMTANLSRSAAAAGTNGAAVYYRRKRWPDFDEKVRAALDAAVDRLEMDVVDAALNGLDQPIVYRGEETGRVRVQSERMKMFVLQAHRPGTYRAAGFRARSSDEALPVPVVNVEEAKARILALLAEMNAREAEDTAIEIERIGG